MRTTWGIMLTVFWTPILFTLALTMLTWWALVREAELPAAPTHANPTRTVGQ
jgi:hypothetical protein